jgi:hypothetical protein
MSNASVFDMMSPVVVCGIDHLCSIYFDCQGRETQSMKNQHEAVWQSLNMGERLTKNLHLFGD